LKKRLLIGGAAAALILAAVVGILVVVRLHQSANIKGSSSVQFTTTALPPVKVTVKPEGVVWPMWGYDGQRLRSPAGIKLRPPFRKIWTFHGRTLLEFPPAVAYGRLYLTTFWGRFYALDEKTGKPIWQFRSGRCGWSSPAVSRHIVFQTFIGHPSCNRGVPGTDGEVVALNAITGRVLWRRTTGPNESSPLVAHGLVYVGDWNGDIWALSMRTGRVRWRFHTGGQIKGSVAVDGPDVVVGSYDGHVYALNALTGKEVWRGSAQTRFGSFSLGTFYSTPAVAYGRVYIGNTDDKVYSYGATTGDLVWSHSTGGYVYSSPAVWDERVYVGSYDGTFYALDAATGDTDWTFSSNGPISGAPTVINGIVYFSTFNRRTYGLDARTGKLVWSFADGKYSPVVADTKRLYLVGYGRMYGMVPIGPRRKRPKRS
jgi:outer membrane protein assembly factor BamB